MGLKGLFLNHAFLDRICPIFSFEYIQNLWQNYVSKSLEGFLSWTTIMLKIHMHMDGLEGN